MSKVRLSTVSSLLLAVSASPVPVLAALEATPYVGYNIQYDDNIFRHRDEAEALLLTGDSELSDTTQDTIIGASLDFSAGRQRLYFDGSIYRRRYDHYDQLDFDGNRVSGGLDWGFGQSLSGKVAVEQTRDLRDFSNFVTQPQRSVEDRTRAHADVDLKLFSSFVLKGGVGTNQVSNSRVTINDYRENVVRGGLSYRGRSQLEVGVESSFTDGEYDERTPVDEYEQTTHSLVVRWDPGSGSSVNFGVGHTERENDFASSEDFSGLTTHLNFTRRISPKSALSLGVRRNVASADSEGQDYFVQSNANLRFDWEPRPRLGFEFTALRQRDDYRGAAQGREDDLTLVGLTADYEFARYFRFRPNLNWEDRSSNIDSQEYDSFRAGLEVRLQYPIR